MNTQLEAAHAAVPEIAEHFERKARVEELLRRVPETSTPDEAAQHVADEAIAGYLDTGVWPDDVEQRAQTAYVAASGAQAVRNRLAALHRDYIGNTGLKLLREAHRSEILAALEVQLRDVLAEARKHVTALGDVRTADEALTAGGEAAEAYTAIRALVPALKNIRAAQWEALSQGELTGLTSLYQRAKDSGFGDVQDVSDATPAEQFEAMKSRRYTLSHLVWLAQMNGVAYVPEDVETVVAAQEAYENRGAVADAPKAILETWETPIVPTPQPAEPRPTYERERVLRARSGRSF
ncbi:hypothetical protein [Streptomyces sp. NBC_00236]|uniref:hypothetical protein n=1 Tax=Streptomyces sp. NBC_00236 TaxID=2903639 RepID=UPI002E2BFA7A|nr:hypothetical protein [Streptomyces sp. NBC_00236]